MKVLRGEGVRLAAVAVLMAGALLAVWPGTALALSAPTITDITPSSGPVAGGTQITITGTDFLPGATVFIAGKPASGVVVFGSTTITATTPQGTTGTVNVLVVNGDGGAITRVGGFFYGAVVSELAFGTISPTSGPSRGGTLVSLTGMGFSGTPSVLFGGTPAGIVSVAGGALLTVRTPPSVSGAVTVTVTNPDGGSVSQASAFTYQPGGLEVTAVSPGGGSTSGGSAVRITGNAFAAGASVTFGGVPAQQVQVVNSTLINAATPSSGAGNATVTVTNPGGGSAMLANGFTFRADLAGGPVISGASPANGPATGGTPVTITGTGFSGGATVLFAGAPAVEISAAGASVLLERTPVNVTGPVAITVINSDGSTATLANGFTYQGSSGFGIVSSRPATGAAAGGTVVTISGDGFVSGAMAYFGDVPAFNVWVVGSSEVVATTPPGVSGAVAVRVVNPGGLTALLPGGFTFTGAGGAAPSVPGASVPLPARGIAIFVSGGGTNAQIVVASGCTASTLTFWAVNASGGFDAFVPGASIGAVNAAWNARFASGVPAGTPLLGRCV